MKNDNLCTVHAGKGPKRKSIVHSAAWLVLILIFAFCQSACKKSQTHGQAEPDEQPKGGFVNHCAFERYVDRSEGAFLVLCPKGWQVRGGMVRVNPLQAQGGAGNAIEAKIDFSILREPSGQAMIRWLPKINYAQPSPYNAMLNGNWNGMPVVAMPDAAGYLQNILFPSLHPAATQVKVLEIKARPDAVAALEQLPVAQTMRRQGARYLADAASVTVSYQEDGLAFQEILFVALEGYDYMGTGLWSNPFTIMARAPQSEFAQLGPMARTVINSFSLNPIWLQAEWQGQQQRSETATATLRDIARIDAEIARNRSQTMAKIQQEEYLTLTNQERYRNPHTGLEELGSNEWKYRWQNSFGEVIYTDDPEWDPNRDPRLNLSGYQRSGVIPRD